MHESMLKEISEEEYDDQAYSRIFQELDSKSLEHLFNTIETKLKHSCDAKSDLLWIHLFISMT